MKMTPGMKTLITILLFAPLILLGQKLEYSVKLVSSEESPRIEYGTKYDSATRQYINDYENIKLVGMDSIHAIIMLSKALDRAYEWESSEMQALQYAEEILSCMRTDGFVTDWKRFREAVKNYMAVKEYRAVMQKMKK